MLDTKRLINLDESLLFDIGYEKTRLASKKYVMNINEDKPIGIVGNSFNTTSHKIFINGVENLIAPFPGGVVPSGSKVGTRYENIPGLFATTNHKYCPTLKDKIDDSELRAGDGAVFEIVLDGATEDVVKKGMKLGIEAAVKVPGVTRISAGNYEGKLGKFLYKLHELGLE